MDEPRDPQEMDTLAGAFGLELERLKLDPEFDLPERVVTLQRRLAKFDKRQLEEILVGTAVALAVTIDGTAHPRKVLQSAFETARFTNWEDVKAKVKRVRHAMRGDARAE